MAKPVKCAANGYSRTAGVELGWTTCVDHTCAQMDAANRQRLRVGARSRPRTLPHWRECGKA
jgi:hypothetical protein